MGSGHKLIWLFEAIEGGNKTKITCTISPAPQSACPFIDPFDLSYHFFSNKKRLIRKASNFASSLVNHWVKSCQALVGEDDTTGALDSTNDDGDKDQSVGNAGGYPPTRGRSYLPQKKRNSSTLNYKETPEK